MQQFYLSSWVPSLKRYTKIAELKMYQLEILSKYILNDDDEMLSTAFDNVLLENLENKSDYNLLSKFDKWFILMFLRASSVESTISYIAGEEVTSLTFDLFEILTRLSEINLFEPQPLQLDDTIFYFALDNSLYSQNYITSAVLKTKTGNIEFVPRNYNKNIRDDFFKTIESTVYQEIKEHLNLLEQKYRHTFIIENVNKIKNFYSIPFRLYDNTLFYFLKSIFKPSAQSLYTKKYVLLSKLHIDLNSINQLTPFECDIYMGILNSTENSKKTKKTSVSL